MSRKRAKRTAERIKCPWCGRVVGFSRSGSIEPHIVSPKVKCIGVGQPRDQVLALIDLHEGREEDKR